MPTWKINALTPNSTDEYVFWEKGSDVIICKNTFPNAVLLCNADSRPTIDTNNTDPAGIEITFQEDDWQLKSDINDVDSDLVQAVSRTWDWGTLADPAARAAIQAIWPSTPAAENSTAEMTAWSAMEAAGWENTETAIWLRGPLLLEQTADQVIPNDYDDPDYANDDDTDDQ